MVWIRRQEPAVRRLQFLLLSVFDRIQGRAPTVWPTGLQIRNDTGCLIVCELLVSTKDILVGLKFDTLQVIHDVSLYFLISDR